jgi:hypothetical protein
MKVDIRKDIQEEITYETNYEKWIVFLFGRYKLGRKINSFWKKPQKNRRLQDHMADLCLVF